MAALLKDKGAPERERMIMSIADDAASRLDHSMLAAGKLTIPQQSFVVIASTDVGFGSWLLENSYVELARRNSVSITLNRKRTALAVTVEGGLGRKQFCALSARARFHTA